MVDLSVFVALCDVAVRGGAKTLEFLQKKMLSKEERDLLLAAAEKGQFHVVSFANAGQGSWLLGGTRHFMEDDDPAVAATYLEAFQSLCERGYVVYEGGTLFMLTGSGFAVARDLAAKGARQEGV